MEIDKKFKEIYFDEKILKQIEKLPNKIKFSLERGKKIEYNQDKLALFINECINIENNIKEINTINENIKKYKNNEYSGIIFNYGSEEDFNLFLKNLKNFGKIVDTDKDRFFDSKILNNDINITRINN